MSKKAHLGWADIDLTSVDVGEVLKVNSVSGPPGTPIQLGFGEGGGGSALGVAVVAAAQYSFSTLGDSGNYGTDHAEWLFNEDELSTDAYYDPLELVPFGFVNESGEGYLQLVLAGFYTVTVDATISDPASALSNAALFFRAGDFDIPAPPWAMNVARITDAGATGRTTVNSGPVWGPSVSYAGLSTVIVRLETAGTLDTADLPVVSGSLRLSYLGPIPA